MRRARLTLAGSIILLLITSSVAVAHATSSRATTSTAVAPGGLGAQGGTPGSMRITPTSGPAGTIITLIPIHRCTPPAGVDQPRVVAWLAQRGQTAGQLAWDKIADADVRVGAGGAWTATVRVPAGTAPGRYRVSAECWNPADTHEDALPYFSYRDLTFTVTSGPATVPPAPPAQPVPGTPTFTG